MMIATNEVKIVAWFDVTPNTKKLLRGLLFMIGAGVVSLVAILEDGDMNAIMAVSYLVGSLLVYGIDIATIEFGSLRIEFETDNNPADRQTDIDTDWNKED